MDLLEPLMAAYPRQSIMLGVAAFAVWLFLKADVTRPVIAIASASFLFVLWTADDLNVPGALAEHVTSVMFASLEPQEIEPPPFADEQGGGYDPAP